MTQKNTTVTETKVKPLTIAEGVYMIPAAKKTGWLPTKNILTCESPRHPGDDKRYVVFAVGTPRWRQCLACYKAEHRAKAEADLPAEVMAAWAQSQAVLGAK